jgi:asparagine synthase (glutamine-hydrolysing)
MGNMLLRDSDVFSMAHGLELRVPLLHLPMVRFAFGLPGAFCRPRDGQRKPLLAEATRDILPATLLRQPKQGFVLPYASWMKGPLRERFEARWKEVMEAGLLAPPAVRQIRAEFLAQPHSPAWSRAWALGVLGQWLARTREAPAAQRRAEGGG